jgi:hypothetical protein
MTTTNTTTNELTLADKIGLYLTARGWKIGQYHVAGEGLAYKDSAGKFTLASRLTYERDGKALQLGFRKDPTTGVAIPQDEALRRALSVYLKARGVFSCQRCGGAGGAQKWPGWTCYDCGGDGIDHRLNIEREIDRALKGEDFCADYIAKREAKLAAAKVEQERIAAENAARFAAAIAQQKIDYAPLVAAARAIFTQCRLDDQGDLAHFINTVEEGREVVYSYTVERVTALVAKFKKNEADPSQHIGTVGERATITATVVFTKDFNGTYGPGTLTVLRDEAGNVLKYWNAIRFDGAEAQKGDKVTFSAGIKEHGNYQGVNETVLTRVTKAKRA